MAKTVSVEQELAELARLRALVPQLKERVSSAGQRNVVLSNDLGSAHDRIAKLEVAEAELKVARETLGHRDKEIASLQASLNSVAAKVDKADATLAAARQMRDILDRVL